MNDSDESDLYYRRARYFDRLASHKLIALAVCTLAACGSPSLADLVVSSVPQGFSPVALGQYETALPLGAVSIGNLRDAYHRSWSNGHGSKLDVQIVRFSAVNSAAKYEAAVKASTLADAGGEHTTPISAKMIGAFPNAFGRVGTSGGVPVSEVGFSTGDYVVSVVMSGSAGTAQVTTATASMEYTLVKAFG